MAKITAPNNKYCGIAAGIIFLNGVGETSDPYLIQWFKEHGYKVEEQKEAVEPENKRPSKRS